MRTSLSGEIEDEQVGRADSGLHFQKPRTAFFEIFLLAILVCPLTCWLRKKIPPHLALRERNKQIQKIVQLLTWWSKSDQKKSAQHLTIAAMLLHSSTGRVAFVEGILDAKMLFAAAPVCGLTATSPHVPNRRLRSNPTRPPPHQ
jgi:hypothetical protein